METDYQKMYENLTVLLEDICQFLSTNKLGYLSHRDKKLMESLITRSKVQLQEIEKLKLNSSCNEDYVDMEGKKDDISKVEDHVSKTTQDKPECLYTELAAKDASRSTKSGFMYMKRKNWIGFDTIKRVYGTIHSNWLLIYFSEKCVKPVDTFNLKDYEAKESNGNKNFIFELTSTLLDGKLYYFTALTHKDMLQWIAHINRCHDNLVLQSKGLDFVENNETPIDEEEEYDVIAHDSQEEIYCEVNLKPQPPQNNNTILPKTPDINLDLRPPLPGRRPLKESSSPVPPLPPIKLLPTSYDSDESYECIQNPKEFDEGDDDEEETYAQYVPEKKAPQLDQPALPQPPPTSETHVNSAPTTVLIDEIVEATKEPIGTVKDKISKYELVKTSTNDNEKKDEFCERKNSSFIHNTIKKTNSSNTSNSTITNYDADVETNTNCTSPIRSPKKLKFTDLSPPVLPPVPIIAAKPKVKDGPYIGRRNYHVSHVNDSTGEI